MVNVFVFYFYFTKIESKQLDLRWASNPSRIFPMVRLHYLSVVQLAIESLKVFMHEMKRNFVK